MNSNFDNGQTANRDPFGLKRLPEPEPPGDAWPHIAAALERNQKNRRTKYRLAAAAVVILALGVFWQLPKAPIAMGTQTPAVAEISPTPATAGENSLESLISLSQKLELSLRARRAELGVVPAQALIYQVELEDLVSEIDEAINQEPQSRELWSQRVNLLLDLNQLYERQLRRDYRQIASL